MTKNIYSFKYLRTVAIFLVALVLTIPFYSAQTFAAVSVTKNEGEHGVPGFLDSSGDVWQLDVRVTGGDVTAADVTVNDFKFQTCVKGSGGYDCSYEFDYSDSVISPGVYPLKIKAGGLGETGDTITLDGSGPTINDLFVEQDGRNVNVRFNVKEEPAKCAGLKNVELIDGAGTVFHTIREFDEKCGVNDIDVSAVFPHSKSKPGRVAVVATDKLDHTNRLAYGFFYDGVVPLIREETFTIGDFDEFVGGGIATVPISVQVEEDSGELSASLSSSALGVTTLEAGCAITGDGNGAREHLYTCDFGEHRIDLDQRFNVDITVRDKGNNVATKRIAVDYSRDNTAPDVTYFGTERTFEDKYYAMPENNTFIVRLDETQSGVDAENVIADFGELNPVYGLKRAADECVQVREWQCFWRGIDIVRDGRAFLVEVRDVIGNRADLSGVIPSVVAVDDVFPEIPSEAISVVVSDSDGIRNFYQSRDRLRVTFEVVEGNGIAEATVDLSEIVSNGGSVEAECSVIEGDRYGCSAVTPLIKSGPDPDARMTVNVMDTAGNGASTTFSIEILSTADDGDVDFWDLRAVDCSPKGLDFSTVKLASQRVFCTLDFRSGASGVTLLSTQVGSCEGNTEQLDRAFMINNFKGNRKPVLVLELSTFTEEVEELTFDCPLSLHTGRSGVALQTAEDEEVSVTIPLLRTKFEGDLTKIEDKIEDAKDRADSGFWGLIGDLNQILFWVKLICQTLTVLFLLEQVLSVFKGSTEAIRGTVFGKPIAIAACEGTGVVQSNPGLDETLSTLQELCMLASCQAYDSRVAGNWYTRWQATLLDWYNSYRGGDVLGGAVESGSLHDNLILSSVGLCLPGVVYNLNKLRQVECRYAYCLENEVQRGVASVESCRELRDYQQCKYVVGEVFQVIPFVDGVDQILGILKSIVTDPVGLIRLVGILSCTVAFCIVGSSAAQVCDWVAVLIHLSDIVEHIASSLVSVETQTEGDLCGQLS